MNAEFKKVISRVKVVQTQLQGELRKYADRRSKDIRKLFVADVSKMKTFIDRERKELEKLQKQLPGEIEKFRKFVDGQKKELEKLVIGLRKGNGGTKTSKASSKSGKGKATMKKKSSGKKSSKTSEASASA